MKPPRPQPATLFWSDSTESLPAPAAPKNHMQPQKRLAHHWGAPAVLSFWILSFWQNLDLVQTGQYDKTFKKVNKAS